MARRCGGAVAGAAASRGLQRPGLGRQRSRRRTRSTKVRFEIELAYVNIGTFTSERVHQSGRTSAATLRANQSGEIPAARSEQRGASHGCKASAVRARRPPSNCRCRGCERPHRALRMLVYLSLNYWTRLRNNYEAAAAGWGHAAQPCLQRRVASRRQPSSYRATIAHLTREPF